MIRRFGGAAIRSVGATFSQPLRIAVAVFVIGLGAFSASAVLVLLSEGRAGAVTLIDGGDFMVCGSTARGREEIPVKLMRIYREAAADPRYALGEKGVYVLAAINKVETDFGRNVAVSTAGAVGWMQFMPATWRQYGVDRNGGGADPNDPEDAIWSAAHYLAESGAREGLWYQAIFAYNRSDRYVRQVLAFADAWRRGCSSTTSALVVNPATVREILGNARIVLHNRASQEADLRSGELDPRLVDTLAAIGRQHSVLIYSLMSDHDPGGNHPAGRAMDIAMVDGEVCRGALTGACADLVRDLARVEGPTRSTELIYCFDPDGPNDPRGFARSDHCDHIHWGLDG